MSSDMRWRGKNRWKVSAGCKCIASHIFAGCAVLPTGCVAELNHVLEPEACRRHSLKSRSSHVTDDNLPSTNYYKSKCYYYWLLIRSSTPPVCVRHLAFTCSFFVDQINFTSRNPLGVYQSLRYDYAAKRVLSSNVLVVSDSISKKVSLLPYNYVMCSWHQAAHIVHETRGWPITVQILAKNEYKVTSSYTFSATISSEPSFTA